MLSEIELNLTTSMISFIQNPILKDAQLLFNDKVLMLRDNSLRLVILKALHVLHKVEQCYLTDKIVRNLEQREQLSLEIVDCITTVDVFRDDYIWEHLNIGHWKTVDLCWRRAYTFLCIIKAVLMSVINKPLEEIIRECDMALLMGHPSVMDNILLKITEEVSDFMQKDAIQTTYKPTSKDANKIPQGFGLQLQNPSSRFEILCIENPTMQQFMEFMKKQVPILITGGIEHWPARKKWSVEYIQKTSGFRTVPVEIGSKYTSEDWTQKLMTINEFIKSFMTNSEEKNVKTSTGYIAQHNLFEQISHLKDDIIVPDYCALGKSKSVEINAWFGPGNTVSPTHYDPKHNLLAQVFGAKLVRLYPPSESELLQPFPVESILFNTSQLDLEDPLLFDKHPNFKDAKYCEFLLPPGVVLYMPPKWWHYIRSITPSFSVSFWFE